MLKGFPEHFWIMKLKWLVFWIGRWLSISIDHITLCVCHKDGNYCRAECPLGKFPNEENICKECAAVCTSHPRGLLDGTASDNWSAVCTGPGDWFGHNGCSQCIQVVATAPKNGEHGSVLKCLTPYQVRHYKGNSSNLLLLPPENKTMQLLKTTQICSMQK